MHGLADVNKGGVHKKLVKAVLIGHKDGGRIMYRVFINSYA